MYAPIILSYLFPHRMWLVWPLQLTVTCTVLTSGLEMSLEAMHSYDPDCSFVMAVSSTSSPSFTNLWVPVEEKQAEEIFSPLLCTNSQQHIIDINNNLHIFCSISIWTSDLHVLQTNQMISPLQRSRLILIIYQWMDCHGIWWFQWQSPHEDHRRTTLKSFYLQQNISISLRHN